MNEIKVTHKPDGENKVSSGAAIRPSGKPAATVKPEVRKRVDTRQIYSYLQGPRSWKEKELGPDIGETRIWMAECLVRLAAVCAVWQMFIHL